MSLDSRNKLGSGSYGSVYGPYTRTQLERVIKPLPDLLHSIKDKLADDKSYIIKKSIYPFWIQRKQQSQKPSKEETNYINLIENYKLVEEIQELITTADEQVQSDFSMYFVIPIDYSIEPNPDQKEIICYEIQVYGGSSVYDLIIKKHKVFTFQDLLQCLKSLLGILRCGNFLIENGYFISDIKIENTVIDMTKSQKSLSLIDLVFNRIVDGPRTITLTPMQLPIQFLEAYKYAPNVIGKYIENGIIGLYQTMLSHSSDAQSLKQKNILYTGRTGQIQNMEQLKSVLRFTLLYSMLFIFLSLLPGASTGNKHLTSFRAEFTQLFMRVLDKDEGRMKLNFDKILAEFQALYDKFHKQQCSLRHSKQIMKTTRNAWQRFLSIFDLDDAITPIFKAYLESGPQQFTMAEFNVFLSSKTKKTMRQGTKRYTEFSKLLGEIKNGVINCNL